MAVIQLLNKTRCSGFSMYLDQWLLDCNFPLMTHARDVTGQYGGNQVLPAWLLMSQYVLLHFLAKCRLCLACPQIAVTFSPEQAFPYYQARLHLTVPGMQEICWDIQVPTAMPWFANISSSSRHCCLSCCLA